MGCMKTVTSANGQQRRAELAAFLRSRRERISPEQAGLVPGTRRRTPGLRREEVAQLAGVGVTWYTWLEQGRPIRASLQVLEAVARTLQLDVTERQHLFRLAEVPDTTHPDDSGPQLRPQVQVILDSRPRDSGTRCCTASPGRTAAARCRTGLTSSPP